MSYDIFGEPLRRGHCEVHPHVHEEFPCSVCLMERKEEQRHRQEAACSAHDCELVKQQRDELLEELVVTLGSLKEICHHRQIPHPESTIRRAEAAIAKAKGGAA